MRHERLALLVEPRETLLMIITESPPERPIDALFDDGLPACADAIVDQSRARFIGAKFRGVADGLHHSGQAALVHQVGDLLYFVTALEVRQLRWKASAHERFEG